MKLANRRFDAVSQKFLDGVTVLDLTRLLPGAVCTMHLADFGADVIKVEEPVHGDYLRWVGSDRLGMEGAFFGAVNRGKQSLTLNLKQADDVEIFLRLCSTADVVVESFRPGVMRKLGLGADALHEIRPSLVYCSLSGYGQAGPFAQKSGHDINYLALAGILDRCGRHGEPPTVPGFPIADIVGSLSASTAILAALLQAKTSGVGATLDIGLYDSVVAHNAMSLSSHDGNGVFPLRGLDKYTGGHAGYAVYQTRDKRYLAVGALEDKFFHRFCEFLGVQKLAEIPLDAKTKSTISKRIESMPLSHWEEVFSGSDCCVTPVRNPSEAMSDDNITYRNLTDSEDRYVPASPFVIDGKRLQRSKFTPELGEHNAEILASLPRKLGDQN